MKELDEKKDRHRTLDKSEDFAIAHPPLIKNHWGVMCALNGNNPID